MRASPGIVMGSAPELYGFTGLIASPMMLPTSKPGIGETGLAAVFAANALADAAINASVPQVMRERGRFMRLFFAK
ncbi:hypothetical protein [Burkholderia cepacia]|uniref:hypothetical protein n=1 Tax=Burkholderia cepacia TaxID=292 RepID=UPI001FC7F19C|nr:hypothetical protein [Burkholderia cepacia]